MNLSKIIRESKLVDSEGFVRILAQAIELIRGERGKIGNQTISEHLVRLEPQGEALVIGDLHGDLESLISILRKSRFSRKILNKDATIVFLGDYGDRGHNSVEVYCTILKLKLAFPEQVILLRGNHEGPQDLMPYPHNLPLNYQERFGENWKKAYSKTREFFTHLYNALLIEDKYLMVHGGVSPEITDAQVLARAHVLHPEKEILEDLLWSDPKENVREVAQSPRGAGKLFGKSLTEKVLRNLDVEILIRGHEACKNGFKFNHGFKVLTLFSRKGSPYFNTYGAYLNFPLSQKVKSAKELISWIPKF